ncbi:class I SAM-dependent methyltransferase [Salinicoccus sp. ID82-1]|uniref:class I SAM-dependent methyltransferase n=1 Tax=Salinicoccus sp. ID82-1 TaxID=2820269 RepID=UPI001F35654B|nr:class I SAM-dependent methyltransferase [Salinicoccus sp. ID82-1]MCG1010535.1 class I SAM-dependent methyltransferase [Salinicoccus sp. ID82-1]
MMVDQHCKLCHAPVRIYTHAKLGRFYLCTGCEFIFKDRAFFLSEDEERQSYRRHNNSIEDPRYVAFFYKFLDDAVFPYIGTGRQGFDFGSGPEPVLATLLEQNHGFQMNIYDIFYAPDKVYQGKKYDLITATEVVEHLGDPLHYFKRFAGLLKPDGVLAVMTLFHHNGISHFNNWHYMRDRTHVSFYTPKTMRHIAEQSGLKVVHTDGIRYTTFMLDD